MLAFAFVSDSSERKKKLFKFVMNFKKEFFLHQKKNNPEGVNDIGGWK